MEATLAAVNRTGKGKNEARRLRASGQVPAVVYGAQKAGDAIAPVQIAVSPKEMMRILHSASGVNTLITLNGPGDSIQKVLVREFQLDPVTQALLHADFYRVNLEKKIAVKVPVVLHGEPKGVKNQGGILEFLHKEVEVECLPTAIPEHIDLDVAELELGQAIYVRDLAANASWSPLSDSDRNRRPRARRRRRPRPSPK
jgi:large subunit ribosomal protein L25